MSWTGRERQWENLAESQAVRSNKIENITYSVWLKIFSECLCPEYGLSVDGTLLLPNTVTEHNKTEDAYKPVLEQINNNWSNNLHRVRHPEPKQVYAVIKLDHGWMDGRL